MMGKKWVWFGWNNFFEILETSINILLNNYKINSETFIFEKDIDLLQYYNIVYVSSFLILW